ncbi:hypothetical protein OsJ_32387 [Oryza sativa Japonica Group]|uniref:Uncharacterized protein n=2 Tax=Oryza sativa TaxID=4530 RepID=Q9FWN4_ORYSJ|nr:hypothetical protein [Oryza sativa Japonica Group]EAZ16908.1 hypothetical protein OsJ_32387 [Oryza sativa Japonica Group]
MSEALLVFASGRSIGGAGPGRRPHLRRGESREFAWIYDYEDAPMSAPVWTMLRDFSKVRVQETEEKQGLGIGYWVDALQQKLHFSIPLVREGDGSIEVVADNNGWSFMGEDVVARSGISRKSRM